MLKPLFIVLVSMPLIVFSQTVIKEYKGKEGVSQPLNFLTIGETTFFTADDGVHGRELWKTDGTESGTRLVKDLIDGCVDVANDSYFHFTNYKGKLVYFIKVYDKGNKYWLCQSDGTEGGTQFIKEFNEVPSIVTVDNEAPSKPFIVGDNLCFFAGDYLWKTNGTLAGTEKIKKLMLSQNGNIEINGYTYFTAVTSYDGSDTTKLWRTDGTMAGTIPVAKLENPYSPATFFTAYGNYIYFIKYKLFRYNTQSNTIEKIELWDDATTTQAQTTHSIYKTKNHLFVLTDVSQTTNGLLWVIDSAKIGAKIVYNFSNTANNSLVGLPEHCFTFQNKYYCIVKERYPSKKSFILVSDGTKEGTQKVGELSYRLLTNIVVTDSLVYVSTPDSLFSINGKANGLKYISKNTYSSSNMVLNKQKIIGEGIGELYSSTLNGTQLLTKINTKVFSNAYFYMFTSFKNQLHFKAGLDSVEYLKTDGSFSNTAKTISNTSYLQDFNTPINEQSDTFFKFNNKILYPITYSSSVFAPKTTLIMIDGMGGSQILLDTLANLPSRKRFFTHYKGKFIFKYEDSLRSRDALWISDGTQEGTKKFFTRPANIGVNTQFSILSKPIEYKEELYFLTNNQRLWKTNGTNEGTMEVPQAKDSVINIGDAVYTSSFIRYQPVIANDKLFLVNYQGKFWTFNGKTLDLIKDYGFESSFIPYDLNLYNIFYPYDEKTVYFTVVVNNYILKNNITYNYYYFQLTKSDGTIAGTQPIKNFKDAIFGFQKFNNQVFFITKDSVLGVSLWKTDGTSTGTKLVKAFSYCNDSKYLGIHASTIVWNNKLYFVGMDNENGYELWETDGTEGGTKLAYDILKGSGSSDPSTFYVFNDELYFSAAVNDVRKLFKIGNSTGIVELVNEVSIYPNPVQDNVIIENNKNEIIEKLEIYNAIGQLLKSMKPNTPSVSLNIQDLPKGILFVSLTHNHKKSVQKIAKID
jgi:trimeric autotransporter adhesin